MDHKKIQEYVEPIWDDTIVPTLSEYIKIPNKSPLFDRDWQAHGYMNDAVNLLSSWAREYAAKNMTIEVIQLEGRTPLLYIEVPGESDDTIVLYGHYDKQPEMTGWDADLDPWKPVLKDNKLYGRGGADDGYALFASLTAINALQAQSISHARCVILIEGCEESGSFDLPFYIDALADRIGVPQLVICLDSGAGNYDQLWMTTSLRGNVLGDLSIELLKEGVHSGNASGIVPSSFRVLRQLLNRIEDPDTGEILLAALQSDIPAARVEQARAAAEILGDMVHGEFPFHSGVKPLDLSPEELILNRTWRAALAVTGAAGLPSLENAGNVMRPNTTVKLSMRTPPTCDVNTAAQELKTILEKEPPYNAKVEYKMGDSAPGWNAPLVSEWLSQAAENASQQFFAKPAVYMGEGGSIPFMGMLGEKFPDADFLITGVLGPHSNAHGPNEFLHIPMGKKVTCCVASVIAEHTSLRA